MFKKELIFIIAIIFVITVSGGYGLIPPLSDKELEEESDLIIKGFVLGVLKTGKSTSDKWERHHFNSWVRIDKVYKGDAVVKSSIVVNWTDYIFTGKDKDHIGGPSGISLYPGETVKLYLKFNKSTGSYYGDRWNCAEKISGKGGKLPQKIGDHISVK